MFVSMFLTQLIYRLIIFRVRKMHHIYTRFTPDHCPLALWYGTFIKQGGYVSQGRLGSRCSTFDGIITHVLPNAYIQVPSRRLGIP